MMMILQKTVVTFFAIFGMECAQIFSFLPYMHLLYTPRLKIDHICTILFLYQISCFTTHTDRILRQDKPVQPTLHCFPKIGLESYNIYDYKLQRETTVRVTEETTYKMPESEAYIMGNKTRQKPVPCSASPKYNAKEHLFRIFNQI